MNHTYYEQTAVLYLDDAPLIPDNSEMTQQISARSAQAVPMIIVRGTPPGIDWRLLRQTVKSLVVLATMLVTMIISLPLITRVFASHTSSTLLVPKNMAAKSFSDDPARYRRATLPAIPAVSIYSVRRNRQQIFTVDPGAPMPEDGSF